MSEQQSEIQQIITRLQEIHQGTLENNKEAWNEQSRLYIRLAQIIPKGHTIDYRGNGKVEIKKPPVVE